MGRSIPLLLLFVTTLSADPITVTILNQTIQTQVQAEISGSAVTCDNVGVYSASCDLNVPATQGVAVGNANVNFYAPILTVGAAVNNAGT